MNRTQGRRSTQCAQVTTHTCSRPPVDTATQVLRSVDNHTHYRMGFAGRLIRKEGHPEATSPVRTRIGTYSFHCAGRRDIDGDGWGQSQAWAPLQAKQRVKAVRAGAQWYPSIQRRLEEQVKVLISCTVSSRPGHETIAQQKQSKDAKRRSIG